MADFHNLTVKSCFKKLNSSENGLSSGDVKKRIKRNGLNKLEEEKMLGRLSILLSQFQSPLIYILLFAGLISFLLKEYVDMSVILGAVFINTIIGFFQENKANKALSKLRKLVENKAIVLRDGHEIQINSSFLTIGDIILLQAGNRVPVDSRIISGKNLQINEANLTGESVPSEKYAEKVAKGASLADRKNMVYASTVIVRGSGRAIVTNVGSKTEIGKIAQLTKATPEEKTPLQLRLSKLSKYIGIIVAVISILVVCIGIFQGRDFFNMFIIGVAIAVAAIPEGLVVSVTVILVLGMQHILKKKALVRKLVAAETLGSTTVICTDKTGTLTEGRMNVVHIIIGEKEFELNSLGSRQDNAEARNVSLALQAGMMCNSAIIENPNDELAKMRIIGAPTEVALLLAAAQSGLNKEKLLKAEIKIGEFPFCSEKKFMITLHKKTQGGYVLYEKGAPERLLEKSSHFYHRGKIFTLRNKEKEKLDKVYESLTKKGLRVIGVAMRNFKKLDWKEDAQDSNWDLIDNNLIFIGFIALKDPLRPEAKETIKTAKIAGIRTVIITGDHRLTAKAIGEEIGLNTKSENIITGDMLDKIDDKKLKDIVNKINIYARVSPHHKLRIIKALRARGEVVAMTGDGINDSPALKAADIGISLGTGTDIAKETSDIILLDNNFKTILSAIKQGRIIFSNIRKVITYLVSDSFSEIVLIVGSMFFGAPLAILPVQILWINIINDGLPHFSLAFEKGENGIMEKKPIKKSEPIINGEMKTIILGVGFIRDIIILALFILFYRLGSNIDYLRTIFFAILGFKSLISIFSLRSFYEPIWRINPFSNIYLLGAVGISMILLFSAIYWPPLQAILSTSSIGFDSWILIGMIGILNIFMIEITKYFFMKKKIALI